MKRDLNQYLYYEFGFDDENEDDANVSDNRPFDLEFVGEIRINNEVMTIYLFESDNEKYYAIDGPVISYFPQGSMNLDNLRRQLLGSKWIAQFEIVNLQTVALGDPIVLPTEERRDYIRNLAKKVYPEKTCDILEGLFLKDIQEYIALVKYEQDNNAHIIGDRITVRNIPFSDLSPWRRLAAGIGKLIEDGKLEIGKQ
ncbi:MAG: hypothetical protein OEV87_05695 [Phycisphaerae bacterium]|nr:hypothetical protein [Phycisphaerae bacterium]